VDKSVRPAIFFVHLHNIKQRKENQNKVQPALTHYSSVRCAEVWNKDILRFDTKTGGFRQKDKKQLKGNLIDNDE
jgi:hypothetical protein